jgi:phospholipid transport system substrate-binding protein
MKTLMKPSLLSVVLSAALLASAPVTVFAQAAAPATAARQNTASQVVLASSTRILTTLDQRRAEFKSNPAALRQFVTTEFNTLFDGDYAARLVLGVHGRGASDADVKLFGQALTERLLSAYGARLADFNARLKVRVKSETPLPGGRGVKVDTEFLQPDQTVTPITFYARNVGGQWKVFDVLPEGVSFVQTFKTQFDTPLRQKSIAQVAADLKSGKLQVNGSASGR